MASRSLWTLCIFVTFKQGISNPEHRSPSLDSQVKVTLRLTVSQSMELIARYLLLFDSYGLVFVARPL
jgi:hypothetical protein